MEREYLRLFSSAQYHIILSKRTGKPYLDQSRSVYIFQSESEGESFASAMPEPVEMSEKAEQIEQNRQIVNFYANGAVNIKIKKAGERDLKEVPITATDVPRNTYYNTELNAHILLLKETALKKYLTAMKKDLFFIPVSIPDRALQEYPVLYYVDAKMRSGQDYLVVFSTLKSFDMWNDEFKKNCAPVEVDMERLIRTAGKRDVIINPMDDKLFLLNKQLKEILQ